MGLYPEIQKKHNITPEIYDKYKNGFIENKYYNLVIKYIKNKLEQNEI
jgi:hypothetical protein